ncbi:MAG: hypothetical protein H6712_00245 [Myxococcales bacterium]|nr:hypothetical protein [Myxococcales bacterium]MCB9712254.1 hypothetical protein [Myxococcales bacterium]
MTSPRAWPSFLPRLGLAFALGIGLGSACTVQSIFTCLEDQSCIDEGGEGGVCESNSFCTFPDESCPNGKRWHERAGDLAGKCYEPADIDGTGNATEVGTGSGSGEGGSSEDGGSTTQPADDSGGSSDGAPMTDDGGSSGGAGATCDEVFGAVAGYELCEETGTTCKLNVTLSQTSCTDLCGMYGAMMCQTAFTNDASDCASEVMEVSCDEVADDNICVCVK